MVRMNSMIEWDVERLHGYEKIPFQDFLGKTILITGATGLIGQNLVYTLAAYSQKMKQDIHILVLVRSEERAKQLFVDFDCVQFLVGDIVDKISYEGTVDYIIHGASKTSSKAFIGEPVETITTAVQGTLNVLEFAKQKQVKGLVYLSSMEVYGAPKTDEKIEEDHFTDLDTMKVRSSYPESKRMCEAICCAYADEYNVPVKVARLTQTFGPGVQYEDGRVFAEFIRCVMEKRDIVLHTKGDTKRSYLYTADAVSALLIILIRGNVGEAYNVANEQSYCSIYEMACLVAKECGKDKIQVRIESDDISKFGYAPTLHMNLSTRKLKGLGWDAQTSLNQMFFNLLESFQ